MRLVQRVVELATSAHQNDIVVDFFADPVYYVEPRSARWGLWGLQIIDTRADLLNASRLIDEAALDPYSFIRDAYLQRREDLVHDGNPPD